MPTETLPTRRVSESAAASDNLPRGLWIAIGLHALAAAALLVAAWVSHLDPHWGDQDPTAGSIQANMVSAIPLPAKVKPTEHEVLATEHPSVAPTPPPPEPPSKSRAETKPRTEPPPRPDDVPVPGKSAPPKDAKSADRPQPETPKRAPAAPPPPTPKATTGEAASQLPMAVTQMRNGTASLTVDDRPFGERYAYYIKLISQKIAQSKAEGDPDGPETRGKKTVIRFVITRDGSPTDATIESRSGSGPLDMSTLRAIQRIDSFGPLPAGDHFVVHFEYDSK